MFCSEHKDVKNIFPAAPLLNFNPEIMEWNSLSAHVTPPSTETPHAA